MPTVTTGTSDQPYRFTGEPVDPTGLSYLRARYYDPPPQLLVERGVAHGPLVFTATDGGPLNGSFVTHTLQKLLKAHGCPVLRTHDLRHLFVSNLFASGVPLELISPLVGHANPQVTRSIYLHLRADRKAEAAAKIDHLWAETGS